MKAWNPAIALIATAVAAGAAMAQSTTKNDGTPTTKQPATTAKPAIGNPAAEKSTAGTPTKAAAAATRDWNAIDSNDDKLISGEEMEKYLQANRNEPKK